MHRDFGMTRTFTKNGTINITNANSTFGLLNGAKIKSLTPSQKSSCINSVIVVFTMIIKPT